MKLFLALALVSCSFVVWAQEADEPSLFPELSAVSSGVKETPDKKTSEIDNTLFLKTSVTENFDEGNTDTEEKKETEEQVDESSEYEEADLFQEDKNKEKLEEQTSQEAVSDEEDDKEDEKKEQFIYMVIDDVNATLTPNRNASYCSATLGVANLTKKELKLLAGTFTIGDLTKEFKFANLAKDKAAAGKYLFVGTSCEKVLDPPAFDIKSCQIEGWSEKKCKQKVKFMPIPTDENVLE